jgi:hypothetical protein
MKKLLLLLLLLINYTSYSQTENTISKLVCKKVDEFTDKVSFSSEGSMLMYEDGGNMKSEGMIGVLFLSEKKGKIVPSTFYLKVIGIEGCIDEGSTLDIIFDNDEKLQLVNWNKFNCDGTNYFDIRSKEELFKKNKIKALKYTNKRNYNSMIVRENIDDENSSYLMNLLLELDKINNGEVSLGVCKG